MKLTSRPWSTVAVNQTVPVRFGAESQDYGLFCRPRSRSGAYDSSDEKGTLRGSIAATLQKKMLVNTAGVLFELLGKTNDRTLITSAGSYLGGAFYQLYRALHRASGGKEGYFGLDATAYQSGAVDAQMRADYIAYASSLAQLSEKDGAFASMEDEALASLYPGLMQSVTQVLHSTEEKTNSLLGRK